MVTVLLDANVLLALSADQHQHHPRVAEWFAELEGRHATCPITQATLIRLLMMYKVSARDAMEALADRTAHDRHDFWPDSIGLDQVRLAGVVGHRQVTDAYLAGLARHNGGRIATLDVALAALHTDVADLIPD